MRLEVEWDFVEFGHIFLETKKKKKANGKSLIMRTMIIMNTTSDTAEIRANSLLWFWEFNSVLNISKEFGENERSQQFIKAIYHLN